MGSGVSPWLVGALLIACGAAATSQVVAHRARAPLADVASGEQVELVVQEVARCANGQAVLVLREKGGERRLPVPIGPAEATALDRRLHGERGDRPRSNELAASSIAALGGRVTRASIEQLTGEKVFLGHVTVAGQRGKVELESRAQDSVALALDAGAPILVSRSLLDQSGINPSELTRAHSAEKARSAHTSTPAPVWRI